MSDDLETADISTRVHNTRPHQEKVYSPIGRHNSGKKQAAGNDDFYDDYDGEGGEDIKFFDSGRDVSPKKKNSRKRRDKEESERAPQEVVVHTPVEKAQQLFKKISKKISIVFDRHDQAKMIVTLLIKFRDLYALEEDVMSEACRWGLIPLLLTHAEKLYKFGYLVEEGLNCMLPIVRSPTLKIKAMQHFIKSGGLIFCMTAIRMFHKSNGNIRVLTVELLSCLLDFITGCNANPNEVSSKIKKYISKNYVIHHLLLHGAASSLPSLLNLSIQSSSEISTQRILKCLTFVLTETPPDMSVTVAMNNRWAMLRDLLSCLRTMNPEVKVQAAVLLTGLIASSAVVAEKLIEMQAWDDLSTALVSPDLDFTRMPAAWLERSMDTMKLLQSRNISKKVKIPQQSICEKFTYISFEQDSQSVTNFDNITPTYNLDSSLAGGNESDGQRLSELPSVFWPQTSPHVMRDEINDSKVPDMKTRLETSPFGDPRLILERNEKAREMSKLSQQKLRQGTSRLLKNPHPQKVLRTTQRKKLYPSQPEYQQQQQQLERSRSRLTDSGPVEVPVDTVQQKVVAEKLFSMDAGSSRPLSAAGTHTNNDDNLTPSEDTPSSMDHLSYAERLQVMILHCQDSYNKNEEEC